MAARTNALDIQSESFILSLNTNLPMPEPDTVLGAGIQQEQDKVTFS